MKVNLIDVKQPKIFSVIPRIFGLLLIILVFALTIFGFCCGFSLAYTVFFSIVTIPAVLLFLVLKTFTRICQSVVHFCEDRILVLNKRGKCWREILYSNITGVRIEDIDMFSLTLAPTSTRPAITATYKCICVFMNNKTEVPNCSYFHWFFYQKDFFPIVYSQDALDFLSDRISMVSENINKKTDT